jgi:hypothetical protein
MLHRQLNALLLLLLLLLQGRGTPTQRMLAYADVC